MDMQSDRRQRIGQGRVRQARVIAAAFLLAATLAFAFPQQAAADMTLLKMGWTYNIGFPDVIQDARNPRTGIVAGMSTYRVLASGGEGWYRLQRVVRHPNGGWYSPRGIPAVWVNMGYAYMITEQQ